MVDKVYAVMLYIHEKTGFTAHHTAVLTKDGDFFKSSEYPGYPPIPITSIFPSWYKTTSETTAKYSKELEFDDYKTAIISVYTTEAEMNAFVDAVRLTVKLCSLSQKVLIVRKVMGV